MKISYDKATDSLYIHLSDRTSAESDEVNDKIIGNRGQISIIEAGRRLVKDLVSNI